MELNVILDRRWSLEGCFTASATKIFTDVSQAVRSKWLVDICQSTRRKIPYDPDFHQYHRANKTSCQRYTGQLKCDGTRAETRFRFSAKRTRPFNPLNAELNPICRLLALLGAHRILHVSGIRVKSAGASVQSTTGSRVVRINGSNAGYTMFRGSVKGTGYPLHSPVSPFTSPPVRHRVPSHFTLTLHGSTFSWDSKQSLYLPSCKHWVHSRFVVTTAT